MENSNEISILDILELAHSLRQEKLSIETEMNDYFRLQMKLSENSFEAIKNAWILQNHRENLNSLIVSKPENRPSLCSQRAIQLENVEFIEAYKDPVVKSQHLALYVDFLRYIHQSPQLIASCLTAADELPTLGITSFLTTKAEQMSQIAQIISAGLYGNSIHGKDVEMMLKLLDKLLEVKIATTDDPRRLLRQNSSSFARLYHKFHESSLSSKLFLTATLHEPVMSVLINDTIMLNVDHVSGMEDLIPKNNNQINRSDMIDALYNLSIKFIESISANWIIFPSTIRWLVQTMSKYLHSKGCDSNVILEILTDMVFGHFICPACTNPNLYGITDAPISENARFNLIQIGQILQSMALAKHQNVDKKFIDLFDKFDKNIISNLMDRLLENTYDISEMGLSHQLPTLYNIGRSSILITHSELTLFLQFLRASVEHLEPSEKKKLKSMLDNLPALFDSHQTAVQARIQNGMIEISPSKKSKLMGRIGSKKIVKNTSASSLNSDDMNDQGSFDDSSDRVLIIPLSIYENSNKMRPLSEDEVLNMNQVSSERTDTNSLTEKNIEELSRHNNTNNDKDDINDDEANKEKPAKFILNPDDVSIGNTSDNLELEAVSEAPSNHSVASSLDLEENNDNLSDMVSANVSGRGTPNISGRDTPSSQVIDVGEVPQIPTPQMAKIINKARNDIDDKFCKFEIKKLIEGDETISIISDTWSTDVLASDSETIEANERNFSTPLIPSIIPDSFQLRTNNFDISETQSESAWSTDVLIASDSEKNGEIDNEDTQSITTRSDITDSITPRDQEVPTTNHTPDSPFYTPRVPNINFRPIDPSNITPRTPDSPFSFRSTDDSPRPIPLEPIQFRNRNINRDMSGSSRNNSNQSAIFASNFNYLSTTSSSVNTQHRPLRQHSNESQTSEQEPKQHKSPSRDKKQKKEFIDQQQPLSVFRVSDPNLENFTSDNNAGNKVIKTSINLINPFMSSNSNIQDQGKSVEVDEPVEHRRVSNEQRSMSYDSRRNGMIDLPSSPIILSRSDNPFDIQLNTTKPQQSIVQKANSIDIDGELCAKAESLKLTDSTPSTSGTVSKIANGSVKNHKVTGAIPKSISFDSTADKVEKSHHRRSDANRHSSQHQSTGIFNKIKQGFRNKRGKGRNSIDDVLSNDLTLNGNASRNQNATGNGFIDSIQAETTDEILAKYRRKPSSSSDAATSDSAGSNNSSSLKSKSSDNENRLSSISNNTRETDYFNNAKRKLRLVLSTSDCHACDVRNNNASTESPLLSYLQMQLAQAMNQQNFQQLSYVHEVLRSLNSLDANAHYKLIEELQKDLVQRQSYLQYLIRLRQDLLSTIATIDNFQKRLQVDREMTNRHLVMVCVRMFMEKREPFLIEFQEEFNSKPAADEKLELMEEVIARLMEGLKIDNISQGMNEWQLIEARNCIEKILLQRLYQQVMFPNDDVDISNDQLLHNCIKKLGRVISPSHPGLKIPHRYLNESPWPFAQKQISYISAYKTPQEKVQCVVRCIQSIMYLLKMASNQEPAADDLVPVLIYVIIKANPPYLQSTINYVECFMGKNLEGEDLYWWTQFSTAILFIKTMIERMEKTGRSEHCE